MYFARSYHAKDIYLAHQKSGSITKTYYACVYGHIRQQFGIIDAYIGHHATDQTRMVVDTQKAGKHITTRSSQETSYIYTDTGNHAVTRLMVTIHA